MDRSYKEDIPKVKRVLEELKREFSGVVSTTDWTKLRIEPLLDHVKSARAIASVAEIRAGDCTVETGSCDVPLRPGLPPRERQGAEADSRR